MVNSSDYLALFKREAEDYLATLNKGLLSLEKGPAQPAVIDELFRAAHTLKGALRMMGYMDIQNTAHRLEDLFGKMKNGEVLATTSSINQALEILDAMTVQLEALWPRKTVVETAAEEYIRIPASRIDTLLNLVGELLIYKAESSDYGKTLRHLSRQAKASQQKLHEAGEHIAQLLKGAPQEAKDTAQFLHPCHLDAEHWKSQVQGLEERISNKPVHLDSLMDELQFKIKQLRMLPCATIFDGLERLVRDIAQQENKKVSLEIEGGHTELDKKVLEGLKPCLIHLLRNAMDHGIEHPEVRVAHNKPETGTIFMRAHQQGNKILIEIQDDGEGINPQTIRETALRKQLLPEHELLQMDDSQLVDLIFTAGFSTRATVSDLSGRGVGMDVVRQEIEQLKGQVLVSSEIGKGTKITLELPLTIAILKVLMVEAEGQLLGFPAERVEEIVSIQPAEMKSLGGRQAMRWRDRSIPLVSLGSLLGLPSVQDPENDRSINPHCLPVIIASYGAKRIAFQVDRIRGEEEIFLKSLESQLGKMNFISGATILGDGGIVIVLNVTDMIQASQNTTRSATHKESYVQKTMRRILIVEDSLTSREMERNILEAHGYHVQTAVDGLDALEKLAQKPVDLVVSDVEMPRMGGFEFCQTLRQRLETKDLPVIFITSLDKEEEKRRGIEAGGQAYITKGRFDQNQLLQTIERLVG